MMTSRKGIVFVGVMLLLASASSCSSGNSASNTATTSQGNPLATGSTPGADDDRRDDLVLPTSGPVTLAKSAPRATVTREKAPRPVVVMQPTSTSFIDITNREPKGHPIDQVMSHWGVYFHNRDVAVALTFGDPANPTTVADLWLAHYPDWYPTESTFSFEVVGPGAATLPDEMAGVTATFTRVEPTRTDAGPGTATTVGTTGTVGTIAPRRQGELAAASPTLPWTARFAGREGSYATLDTSGQVARGDRACLEFGSLSPPQGQYSIASTWEMATSTEELTRKLSVSLSASYDGGLYGGSAAANYVRDTKASKTATYLVGRASVGGISQTVDAKGLTAEMKEKYDSNFLDFFSSCGDAYPLTINSGATYLVILTVEASSLEDKSSVEATAKVNIGKFKADSTFKDTVTKTFNDRSISVHEVSFGVSPDGWKPATDLDQAAVNFSSFTQKASDTCNKDVTKCIQSVTFKPYADLGLKDHSDQLEAYWNAIRTFENWEAGYLELSGLAKQASTQPDLWNPAPGGGGWLPWADKWSKLTDDLVDAQEKCSRQLSSCAQRLAAFTDPARENAPTPSRAGSCEDLRQASPQSPSGPHEITKKNNAGTYVTIPVYCQMSPAPAMTYLQIPDAVQANNVSQFAHFGALRSAVYERVPFDPVAMQTLFPSADYCRFVRNGNLPDPSADDDLWNGFKCMPWGSIQVKSNLQNPIAASIDITGSPLYIRTPQAPPPVKRFFNCKLRRDDQQHKHDEPPVDSCSLLGDDYWSVVVSKQGQRIDLSTKTVNADWWTGFMPYGQDSYKFTPSDPYLLLSVDPQP